VRRRHPGLIRQHPDGVVAAQAVRKRLGRTDGWPRFRAVVARSLICTSAAGGRSGSRKRASGQAVWGWCG
jgi:hypothetical protein